MRCGRVDWRVKAATCRVHCFIALCGVVRWLHVFCCSAARCNAGLLSCTGTVPADAMDSELAPAIQRCSHAVQRLDLGTVPALCGLHFSVWPARPKQTTTQPSLLSFRARINWRSNFLLVLS